MKMLIRSPAEKEIKKVAFQKTQENNVVNLDTDKKNQPIHKFLMRKIIHNRF